MSVPSKRGALIAVAATFLALLIALSSWIYIGSSDDSKINLLSYKIPKSVPPSKDVEDITLTADQTFDLTAGFVQKDLAGKRQTMLAYNGSTPGPTLRVTQGQTVSINFTNNTNIESTLYAHGVREITSNNTMADLSQTPVGVGASKRYEWMFPDPGMYWYRSTYRADYQQGAGLFGTIIVEPNDETYWPAKDGTSTIVLSDLYLNSDGLIAGFNKGSANYTLMGRYGNVFLVNGQTTWERSVVANSVQRFHIVNASNARPYRFEFADVTMKIVGTDGARVGQERFVNAITIGPGERYVVDVVFPVEGRVAILNNAPGAVSKLGDIVVKARASKSDAAISFGSLRTNPEVLGAIAELRGASPSSMKTLGIDVKISDDEEHVDLGSKPTVAMNHGASMGGMHMMPDGSMMFSPAKSGDPETDGILWTDHHMTMYKTKWKFVDRETNAVNSDINWVFKKGDIVRIKLTNGADLAHPMQHSLHIHGHRFAIASIDGNGPLQSDWKDSITIPSGQTVDIVFALEDSGEWIMQSQNAEHFESGMSLNFKVNA